MLLALQARRAQHYHLSLPCRLSREEDLVHLSPEIRLLDALVAKILAVETRLLHRRGKYEDGLRSIAQNPGGLEQGKDVDG